MLRILTIASLYTLAAAAPASAQANGKALFEGRGTCHVCHGKTGTGTVLAPSLADTLWFHIEPTRAGVIEVIEKGVPKPIKHPAPMPPMGGVALTREEIEALADYVLSLSKKPGGQRQ